MHNGQFVENVSRLLPVFVSDHELDTLIDFLQNGLTDSRVADETFPFDRPSLFRGQDPRVLLFFDADKVSIRWPEPLGALSYQIYRGMLEDLVDSDGDGLPDAGYGDCITQLDAADTDQLFTDTQAPATGCP